MLILSSGVVKTCLSVCVCVCTPACGVRSADGGGRDICQTYLKRVTVKQKQKMIRVRIWLKNGSFGILNWWEKVNFLT